MPEKNLGFQNHLEEEVKKYKGVYVPVRAGLLRRALVRKAATKKLHPNPDDEFCSPKVGPNAGIISRYAEEFRRLGYDSSFGTVKEPLMVEKIRPDGYLILNGHHRWAAAILSQLRTLPIKIVDLPLEEDVDAMLRSSHSDRRVTLDLDEGVLHTGEGTAEKALPFPVGLFFRERLRLGIPALFRFLNKQGYDIWLYSAKYYSFTRLRRLFRLYRTQVTGIVTGTARKSPLNTRLKEKLEKGVSEQYRTTVHIDATGVLRVDSQTRRYEEYPLKKTGPQWSAEIMDLIGALDKNGQ